MVDEAHRWHPSLEALGRTDAALLEQQRAAARTNDAWQEAFGVDADDGAAPVKVSEAEEAALTMAGSLWVERQKRSAAAAWHADAVDQMGRKQIEVPTPSPSLSLQSGGCS